MQTTFIVALFNIILWKLIRVRLQKCPLKEVGLTLKSLTIFKIHKCVFMGSNQKKAWRKKSLERSEFQHLQYLYFCLLAFEICRSYNEMVSHDHPDDEDQ